MASLTLDEIIQRLESRGDAAAVAERLIARPSKSARWNGRDALRELTSEKVQATLRAREARATR